MRGEVLLLGSEGCRLCDEAESLAGPVCRRAGASLRCVDILDDPVLEGRYAERIPVLQRSDTGAELGWPFAPSDVYRFLL